MFNLLISLKRYPNMALFSKSAAKLLQQTAKTCQYLKKNAKKSTISKKRHR